MLGAVASASSTGSHPAIVLSSQRDSPPPPPPSPEHPEFETWIQRKHRYDLETRGIAETALDASLRIERAIGVEPQPAQGIEGTGLLKVLSTHVKSREIEERRRADLRLVVGAVTGTVGFLLAVLGVLKALGFLH